MLLSNRDIKGYISSGDIIIDPFEDKNLGPDSYDIHLGKKILVSKDVNGVIDPQKGINMEFEEINLEKTPYILKRGEFILADTLEKIGLSNKVTAQLEGRSSIGRLGIVIHMTAGLIHAGWGFSNPSTITLEISSVNPNPVKLYYGMGIAQLSFIKLSSPAEGTYISKYEGQKEPLPSRLNMDFKR